MNLTEEEIGYLMKLSVLYVEDDEAALRQGLTFLSNLVGTVFTAANGAEGLEIFSLMRPDIVITDIKMPVMNGLDMTVKIRNMDTDVPIIALTAVTQERYQLAAIDAGVSIFILKPVEHACLIQAILLSRQLPLIEADLRHYRNLPASEATQEAFKQRIASYSACNNRKMLYNL